MPQQETKPPNQESLPTSPEDLFALLDHLGIPYSLQHHPPIFTVAEGEHLKASIPGTHCRNLFLRDKKKRCFLVMAANETSVDLKELEKKARLRAAFLWLPGTPMGDSGHPSRLGLPVYTD